ncbi:hypothetical protein [Pedobacter deserti]|uniref:hypothetical protein n=1 Tax=Pedobacter deserti TaxID=2817382 RepID=UPI002108B32A|nr:hypothetical protein [Pedobacter sp. SYSU D00382]
MKTVQKAIDAGAFSKPLAQEELKQESKIEKEVKSKAFKKPSRPDYKLRLL